MSTYANHKTLARFKPAFKTCSKVPEKGRGPILLIRYHQIRDKFPELLNEKSLTDHLWLPFEQLL